ncbi:transaldolase, partial [Chitiniphilus eburneus]
MAPPRFASSPATRATRRGIHPGDPAMSKLAAIKPLGQRIWLDNLSRGLLQSGAL